MKTALEEINNEYEKAKLEYANILNRYHTMLELLIVETRLNTWARSLDILHKYKNA